MKKLLLLLFCFNFISTVSFGQTNIFPASGRVGIGTTTPNDTSLLHIKGSHTTSSTLLQYPLDASSQLTGSVFLRTWASEPNISYNGTGIGANINHWGMVRMNNTLSSSYIRFIPQTSTGMMLFSTIDAAGVKYDNTMAIVNDKVGIGTATPTEKLDVNGNIQISGTIKYGNAGVRTEYRNNAGLRGDAGAISGFYETYAPLNFPKDDSNWWHLIDSRHSNTANNYAMQFAGSFFDQKLYFRKTNDSPTTPWREIVTIDPAGTTNFGTGTSCCAGNNYTIGVSESTNLNQKLPTLQFHTSGFQEAFLRLAASDRAFEIGDSQGIGVDFSIRNPANNGRNVLISGKGISYFNGGNIGIGTTTPETPLHIAGGPAMTAGWNKTLTLQATYPTIIFNSNSQKWGGIGYDFSSNMNFWVGGSSSDLSGTATPAMSIAQNGNIGIGTTTPTSKLEINSGGTDTGTLGQITTSAVSGLKGISGMNFKIDVTNLWQIHTDNNAGNSLFVQYNETKANRYFTINTNGNVGIGTTTPNEKITLENGNIQLQRGNGGAGSFGKIQWQNSLAYSNTARAFIEARRGANDDGNLDFATANTTGEAPAVRMTINNAGNVGVGTATPTNKLEIKADLGASGLTFTGLASTSAPASRPLAVDNTGKVIVGTGGGSDINWTKTGNDITYANSGNVGIGITTPNTKLDVVGLITSGGNSSTEGIDALSIRYTTNETINNWGSLRSSSASYMGYGVKASPTVAYGFLSSTSNTNIGKAAFTTGWNGGGFQFATAAPQSSVVGNPVTLNPVMSITNEGNVGIGTEAPTEKLSIIGGASFKNATTGAIITNDNYAGGRAYFALDGNSSNGLASGGDYLLFEKYSTGLAQLNNSGGELKLATQNAHNVSVFTNNTINTTFNANGSVNIGATNMPTNYKLAVGGDVIAERVVVKLQANWPDYVFKTGYSLRPLSEVEAFVKINSHLPDVPSEAEIKEKGIDVEQMNATLLKKVEELTLYLIEMKKENAEIKARLQKVEAHK
jgi:hypothetical protein